MVEEFRARRDLDRRRPQRDPRHPLPAGRRARSTRSRTSPGPGSTGAELADRLLLEAGVCVLAGTAFGGVGTNHIRISYANSRENLTEALAPDPLRSWTALPGEAGVGAAAGVGGMTDRPKVFVARQIPDDGIDADRRGHATRESGRTSCRRRGPTLLEAIRGCDGVLTLLTDRVDDEFLDAAGPQLKVVEQLRRRLRQHRRPRLHRARDPGRQHARAS